MKKIGILTYWGVANYGAWTQAYALNKVLTNMYPNCDVKHVAYLEQSHWNSYYKSDRKALNNFGYNWDEIPHTPELDEIELEREPFDVLVVGADSIWEEIFTGVINHDWHLIGKNLPNCKKIISYAPSSGIYDGMEHIPNEAIEGLKHFQSISVRDKTTQSFVERAVGVEVPIVVDPALLWDFTTDDAVRKTRYSNYIVVYGAKWDLNFIDKVKQYAKQKGLLLISIGFINDWCDVNFRRNELRTLEWIGMFASAECVVTSTFHGLMIGLNFNKNIKFCQVDYVKNRSQTLMDICKIPNHAVDFEKKIDYGYVNRRLKEQREYALSWLKEAINL